MIWGYPLFRNPSCVKIVKAPRAWGCFDVIQCLQREEHDVEDISQQSDKMQVQKDEKRKTLGYHSAAILAKRSLNIFGFSFRHFGPGGRKGSPYSRNAGALSKRKRH